ncbi:WD40 repeat-like protein [Morchella conica CCBAS932]|uniref:WD repeat-containing protein JIP5 n=1 Tax=Morchella conica CCBAS932 TaxID=1392247 RepID=A0A3N4KXK1_9PEZI|nr:WD40 repeat-like protein [Morchella conica CCBAS932]
MPYKAHSLTLPSDVFSLALHPSKPLLATGLSSGHVYTYKWPEDDDSDNDSGDDEDSVAHEPKAADGGFEVAWKTRRHKGSCRQVAFSGDGDTLYSIGTDTLLKAASSETGRVAAKSFIPPPRSGAPDAPTALLVLSPQHLLVGTDTGAVHLYDTRTPTLAPPSATWRAVHEDYVSSLTALPSTAASTTGFSRQFVSTGATTLTHLDVRKTGATLFTSEDQEDELLCSAFVSGLPRRNGRGGEKVVTGMASGVATLWNQGEWADHDNRVNVAKASGDSVDAVCVLPEGWQLGSEAGWGRFVAFGAGDGKVKVVKMGSNGVVATMAHSWTEGVLALGVDCEGRIVSGGGNIVKVWQWENAVEEEEEEGSKKRTGSDSDDSDEDEEEDSSDEERVSRKRKNKKRKGGKGKARSVGRQPVATSFKGLD